MVETLGLAWMFVINTGYGCCTRQGEIGKDLPVAYASRAMISAELNYSTTEKELLAMVYAVKHFRPYLYGRKFYLVTDHRPLVWLHNLKDPISRLARWRVLLSDYDYEIVHKPGRINANADALSRNPVLAMGTVSWDPDDKTDNKTDNMPRQPPTWLPSSQPLESLSRNSSQSIENSWTTIDGQVRPALRTDAKAALRAPTETKVLFAITTGGLGHRRRIVNSPARLNRSSSSLRKTKLAVVIGGGGRQLTPANL